MKKIILFLFCLFTINLSQAQKKAITETGEEVILFKNGTWKFQNEEKLLKSQIPTNTKKIKKDKLSTFLVKSNNLDIGVYLNPKKWSFKKAVNNPEAEYEFRLKNEDLYAMLLTEKVEIPLETLKEIAFENGKEAAPDLEIVKEEYRTVNNSKVLLLQLKGTMDGIKFSYYGYYFSNSKGTAQFITYTAQNLMESYIPESEELLNGFIEIN